VADAGGDRLAPRIEKRPEREGKGDGEWWGQGRHHARSIDVEIYLNTYVPPHADHM
jgi:hypothetical protein